jgi:hypothetical protein
VAFFVTTLDRDTKSFNGQITGLPAGTYRVYARMKVTRTGKADLFIDSVEYDVAVAAP